MRNSAHELGKAADGIAGILDFVEHLACKIRNRIDNGFRHPENAEIFYKVILRGIHRRTRFFNRNAAQILDAPGLFLDILFRNKRRFARNKFLFGLLERKTVSRTASRKSAVVRMHELEGTFLVEGLFQAFALGFAVDAGQVDAASNRKNLFPKILVYMGIRERKRLRDNFATARARRLFDKKRHAAVGRGDTLHDTLWSINLHLVQRICIGKFMFCHYVPPRT